MRRQHNDENGSITTLLRLWNYREALKAVPYLRQLLQSLREHWLKMNQEQLQLKRLDTNFGRPDCRQIIQREEIKRSAEHAVSEFEDTMRELLDIDVFCINPLCGLALVPFRHEAELAWFIVDLFSTQAICGWRFHADPLDMRRPISFLAVD